MTVEEVTNGRLRIKGDELEYLQGGSKLVLDRYPLEMVATVITSRSEWGEDVEWEIRSYACVAGQYAPGDRGYNLLYSGTCESHGRTVPDVGTFDVPREKCLAHKQGEANAYNRASGPTLGELAGL